jgi:hypothetical protein
MLWLKNLLFLGLIAGGATALGVYLIPPREPKPSTRYDSGAYQADDFKATVARVDDAFQQRWTNENLTPTQPAPDTLVARRLALGLMGTLPSLEEIRQFEALPEGERLAWWLDHILNDGRFHDYFAERLTRSVVGTEDGPVFLFRRRRFTIWLASELAANKHYDAIVRQMIAGTGLWTDNPATNFITVTAQQNKKNAPDPVRLAGRVTRAFLGLRIDCAECHNHPFAIWKQDDFESLSAFFGETHLGFQGIQDAPGEYIIDDKKKDTKRVVRPAVPFSQELLPEDGTLRQRLAVWVTHKRNPYFARATANRVWAILFGRPLIEPVDNLEPQGSPTGHPGNPMLTLLAEDFIAHDYDLRRLIRVIASTKAFRLHSVSDGEITEAAEAAWAVFPLTRLRPEQVAGSLLQAASIRPLDAEAHIVWRLVKAAQQNDFVRRYGDSGEDDFDGRGGTIPQRLLLMNGQLVRDKINENPLNASTRIAMQAPDDHSAVEVTYLATLTRRPTTKEAEHFEAFLADQTLKRSQRLEDLYWAIVNSTEFSWNH